MRRPTSSLRGPLALVAVAILAGVVAIPALAASPSPSGRADNGNHGGPKDSHEPEVTVTLTGTVAAVADKDGSPGYTLTTGGKTLRLSDGPPWFWGAKNPLGAYVGQSVTIVGEQSGDEVDVSSVNGTALRAPGKPPWAGGPGLVGKSHPGWSQSKADRSAAKQAARDARDKAKAACRAAGTCADDEPEASEAP
ncbi:MAG TPA: SIMPL domain-containing protein [Candidatus Limnocylindrales bacterium]|nr:SIMPL domain-containing protein [Candidatus Limnocylindrales bacterium]